MAMATTPYQRHDQIILSTDTGTVGTCTSFSQDGTVSVEWGEVAQPWLAASYPAHYRAVWHICWDEPPAPIGLNSRAIRHLRKAGRRMSRRNYRHACKTVGRAA